MKAVILAAGMGTRLESVSGGLPKCMVPVGERPLMDRMLEHCANAGVRQVIIVTGYRAETLRDYVRQIDSPLAQDAIFVHNDHFSDMGNFYSLLVAQEAIAGESFIKLDGDLLIDETVLPRIIASPGPAVLAVDGRDGMGEEEMKVRVDSAGKIVEINKTMDPSVALGESIGVERIDASFAPTVFAMLQQLVDTGETDSYYERAYELIVQGGDSFEVVDVTGCRWTEIDDAADLDVANRIVASSTETDAAPRESSPG